MKPIWIVVISVIIAGGLFGGGTSAYVNNKSTKEKNDLQLKIDEANKRINSSTTQAANSSPEQSSETSATSSAIKNYDLQISYNSAHTIATIKNNGAEAGKIDPGYYTYVKIFKQTQNAAYLSAQPDGIGGYIMYDDIGFPTYKLNLATNKLTKLSTDAIDISSTENYAASIKRNSDSAIVIVLTNILSGEQKEFNVPSKYQQAGDVKISPNEFKIAYAATLGDSSKDESGNVYIIDIKTGNQTKVNKDETTSGKVPHINNWNDNDSVDWFAK